MMRDESSEGFREGTGALFDVEGEILNINDCGFGFFTGMWGEISEAFRASGGKTLLKCLLARH